MGNMKTTTKFSRLKVFLIQDNYLEPAIGGGLKKLFLKTSRYSQENNCVGALFSKVAGRKETPTQLLSYADCEFFNNIYFQKHLRTTAFDYSFTIVIYSFWVVSLQ